MIEKKKKEEGGLKINAKMLSEFQLFIEHSLVDIEVGSCCKVLSSISELGIH